MRLGDIARASRRMTPGTWVAAAGWGWVLAAVYPFIRFDENFHWAHWEIVLNAAFFVLAAWGFLLAILLADASVPEGRPTPMGRYAAAIAIAAVACAAYAAARGPSLPTPARTVLVGQVMRAEAGAPAAWKRSVIHLLSRGIHVSLFGSLGALTFVILRNERNAARALAEAELQRSAASQRLMASRLDAAQAQVDPEVTLRELERIEALYERDRIAADALMDDLIVRLREAIPRVRLEESVT
jgi:hypothetical protein